MTKIYGLVVNDNSWRVDTYGIVGDSHAQGLDSLNFYAPGAKVLSNAFAGGNRQDLSDRQRLPRPSRSGSTVS